MKRCSLASRPAGPGPGRWPPRPRPGPRRTRRRRRRCSRGVEHDVVVVPRPGGDRAGVGDVELVAVGQVRVREVALQGAAQLPRLPRIRVVLRRHGGDVGEGRVGPVLLRDVGLGERDRPRDRRGGVAEVKRGVGGAGAPVVVDEIAVDGAVLERLVGVADAARHEDRGVGAELDVERRAEGVALAQVDPGGEDPAGRHRDELVPRLGVDAAGRPAAGVEGHVVLDRAEVGQAERRSSSPAASSP